MNRMPNLFYCFFTKILFAFLGLDAIITLVHVHSYSKSLGGKPMPNFIFCIKVGGGHPLFFCTEERG